MSVHQATDSSPRFQEQVELPLEETTQTNTLSMDHGVFLPQQLADQLTNLLQHFAPTTLQSQVTQLHGIINHGTPTPHHAIVSTAATSQPQDSADNTLSATSSMQPLSLANPNAADCLAVPNPVPALMNPSLASGSFQTEPSHELTQQSLPPVPPRIKECIIKGEYIDFSTLLPKAMFSSSPEPDQPSLFTVQLPSSSGDISVRPAIKSRKITSFSSWMEAWNVYLAVTIDHMPSRAPSLIAYQRIITSASVQYPLESWLTYDIQFRTLAASNPSLRWDVRHADLWLQCITPSRTLHSGRWPCPHCGSTTHYPDRCPFHSYSSRQVPNTQWNAYRGQHTVSSNSTSNVPKSMLQRIQLFLMLKGKLQICPLL